MRTSCISHPEREPLIIIRAWQMEFCDGNACAAALMSYFEYWHNVKLDMRGQAEHANAVAEQHGDEPTQDDSLWQFHTEDDLEAGIMIYKRRSIREAIDFLVEKGVLVVGNNPNPRYRFDKTKHFYFNVEVVQAFLLDRSGKNTSSSGKNASSSGKNTSAIPETTSKTSPKTSPETEAASEIEDEETALRLETERRFPISANIIKDKLKNRADAAGEGTYYSCMLEDPTRIAWLTLRPSEVRALIKEATSEFKSGARFQRTFIDLLDRATRDLRKPETPSASAEVPPPEPLSLEERKKITEEATRNLPPALRKALAARGDHSVN